MNKNNNQSEARVVAKNRFKTIWMSKILILITSFLSMLFSIYLFYTQDTLNAVYVGLWVPSILSAGALIFAGNHEH